MSTINAQNYGDGTSSVPASAVLEGTEKSWANYVQSGPTVEESYNVSSISDDATGSFTVNLTNAFAAATFSPSDGSSSSDIVFQIGSKTTSAIEYRTRNAGGTDEDGESGLQFRGALA